MCSGWPDSGQDTGVRGSGLKWHAQHASNSLAPVLRGEGRGEGPNCERTSRYAHVSAHCRQRKTPNIMTKAPRRHGGPKKTRPYTVDGQNYSVSISAEAIDSEGNVPLRVSFRAEFGSRSVCQVRGLSNRSAWHDYPEETSRISITPRIVCELIRIAHLHGWDPVGSKSNIEIALNQELVQALVDRDPPAP
jgi:hypothetical protein